MSSILKSNNAWIHTTTLVANAMAGKVALFFLVISPFKQIIKIDKIEKTKSEKAGIPSSTITSK